jgi:hypothetical protein
VEPSDARKAEIEQEVAAFVASRPDVAYALISTVMLPLTFIAGVYGMNFKYMPELAWVGGYPFALGLMAVVTIGIFWWFRRRGWLGNHNEIPDEAPPTKAGRRDRPTARAEARGSREQRAMTATRESLYV